MEKCVFCGNTRKSAPLLRFFAVPKEPGMKRIQWLYTLGDKEMGPKDRVCGLHFRQGRPSSDPSHEDFVPHLFLNRDPPEEVLSYLESLDESAKTEGAVNATIVLGAGGVGTGSSSVISGPLFAADKRGQAKNGENFSESTMCGDFEKLKSSKPSILKRKRKQKIPTDEEDEHPSLIEKCFSGEGPSPSKVHILHRSVAEAVGAKHGQTVLVRRLVPVIRKRKKSAIPAHIVADGGAPSRHDEDVCASSHDDGESIVL